MTLPLSPDEAIAVLRSRIQSANERLRSLADLADLAASSGKYKHAAKLREIREGYERTVQALTMAIEAMTVVHQPEEVGNG